MWSECRRDKTAARGEVSCHPHSNSPWVLMAPPYITSLKSTTTSWLEYNLDFFFQIEALVTSFIILAGMTDIRYDS